MTHRIVVSNAGPDTDTVATLAQAGVSTVHEALGRRGLLGTHLRPIWEGAHMAGRAVTVLTGPGDNLMIHVAIEHCRPGDVLVVATTSVCTDGMFGELIATALKRRGVVGLVIDAGARDLAALKAIDFPVWSRAVSPQGTNKTLAGSVNVPVVIGPSIIRPGDVVVADDDGVVVVPLERAPAVAAAAVRRIESENQMRLAIEDGASTLDIMSIRAGLQRLDITVVDAAGTDARSPQHEVVR